MSKIAFSRIAFYLLMYSDAYFLCFRSSRPEVLCKNFLKTKYLFKVIFLDNNDFVLECFL